MFIDLQIVIMYKDDLIQYAKQACYVYRFTDFYNI